MEGSPLTQPSTRIARIMSDNKDMQDSGHQLTRKNQKLARDDKMGSVQQAVADLIPLLRKDDLKVVTTRQIWKGKSKDGDRLTQALAPSRTPHEESSSRWRRPWRKVGKPMVFARLMKINRPSLGAPDDALVPPATYSKWPVLYIGADHVLYVEADSGALWTLSSWYSRTQIQSEAESLESIEDRLRIYAKHLEARTDFN